MWKSRGKVEMEMVLVIPPFLVTLRVGHQGPFNLLQAHHVKCMRGERERSFPDLATVQSCMEEISLRSQPYKFQVGLVCCVLKVHGF